MYLTDKIVKQTHIIFHTDARNIKDYKPVAVTEQCLRVNKSQSILNSLLFMYNAWQLDDQDQ